MKITKKQITYLKEISSQFYDEIKVEFLFHSNKLEGSTFDEEQLIILLKIGRASCRERVFGLV